MSETASQETLANFQVGQRGRIVGFDLPPEQRQRLLEIAEKCPVSQTLQRASDVVSVLDDPAAGAAADAA
jgi:uncharacterized OsmC-like protein